MTEKEKLEGAIAAQEAMRATLGDAVVDMTVAALRDKLASLAPSADAAQRKLVTILFADVSGFTAMSETMDAEEVRDTMNALWEKLDAAILKHGGRIDKHIGDALMAIFGVPAAKEDDPERAVLAALALQAELKAFAEKSGRDLKMRIGVNTGNALLGAVGSNAEFTAMGDAVNLASRLEHAAPIGGILISHDTYLHVRGVFTVETQKPIEVKGKKEMIQTYIVARAKPRAFRIGTRGLDIETKMVGRDAELKQLQDGMEASFEDRETQMTTVVGDAGMGKSRLLFEFTQWFDLHPKQFWYFAGRASPGTADAPFGLLRDVISQRFQIADGDATAAVRDKFERGASEFLKDDPRAAEKAHYIGRLLGFDFADSVHVAALASNPTLLRERGAESLVELLRAAEKASPILLLLEDVHWADDASLDFVASLLAREKGLRLFILALSRPTLYERRPSWGEGQTGHRKIALTQLSKRDSRRLVDDILSKVEALPESLRDMVVSGSEGNPFYVEELIRMLMEDGVIDRSGERWRVNAERLAEAKVPATLVGVLQARLDSLAAAEKEVLQCASVIGRIFWDDGVGRMFPAVSGELMEKLRGKDMVFRRENSAFQGINEFIFKHALLRDVAYESVLKKQRREYHAVAARWLTERAGERAEEFAAQIARHHELAGDIEKAAGLLRQVAANAYRRGAIDEAVAVIMKAAALLPADSPTRAAALIEATRFLCRASNFVKGLECAHESRRLSAKAGDERGVLEAMNAICFAHRLKGDPAELSKSAAEFREMAEKFGDEKFNADALLIAGTAAHGERDRATALALLAKSLAIYESLGDHSDIASCHNLIGITTSSGEDWAAARPHYVAAVEHFAAAGDKINEMLSLGNLAFLMSNLGERAKAREMLMTTAAFQRDNGIRRHLASTLDSLAGLNELDGDDAKARQLYVESVTLWIEMGAGMPGLLTKLAGLARLLARTGSHETALPMVACVLSHPATNPEGLVRAKTARALLDSALGAERVGLKLAEGPPADVFAFAREQLSVMQRPRAATPG